jgi:hypothetical protein
VRGALFGVLLAVALVTLALLALALVTLALLALALVTLALLALALVTAPARSNAANAPVRHDWRSFGAPVMRLLNSRA